MDKFGIGKNSSGKKPGDSAAFDSDDTAVTNISHSPLDLGGGGAAEAPTVGVSPQPAVKVSEQMAPAERITGVKTFFAKLASGSIEFLDEQITNWLKANPEICIKRTNVVTGEVQGKKAEPNLIVTVWY